jgi:hypothetical protein
MLPMVSVDLSTSEGISEYRREFKDIFLKVAISKNPCDQIETDLFLPQNYVAGLGAEPGESGIWMRCVDTV